MISVEDGQEVKAGDVIQPVSPAKRRTRDITGGLPRVAELFEARIPKDNAVKAGKNTESGQSYEAISASVVRRYETACHDSHGTCL